jgi:hypothetical protein
MMGEETAESVRAGTAGIGQAGDESAASRSSELTV